MYQMYVSSVTSVSLIYGGASGWLVCVCVCFKFLLIYILGRHQIQYFLIIQFKRKVFFVGGLLNSIMFHILFLCMHCAYGTENLFLFYSHFFTEPLLCSHPVALFFLFQQLVHNKYGFK